MITRVLSVVMTTWRGSNRVVITIPIETADFRLCHWSFKDNELKLVGHITNPLDASSTERGSDQSRMDASYCHQLS